MDNKLLKYIEKHSKKRDKELVYDFMPSLLEIIERPAHIGGKVIIYGICALILFAVIWASLSKIDVIISARGTIETKEEPKTISAELTYEVLDITVTEGQTVKKGDLLVDLKVSDYEEQKEELTGSIQNTENMIEVYNLLLSEEGAQEIDISRYENKYDIEDIIDEFGKDSDSGSTYYGDSGKEDRINSRIKDCNRTLEELQNTLAELEENNENAPVYASCDGVVSEVLITEGSSIYEGQEMMKITPVDAEKRMKCYISESDIAEVEEGQEVKIKLDAYPYSDYGTIEGKISFISNVASPSEGGGNSYTAYVEFEDKTWQEKVKIGMSGNAEMVIGKRRLIEYFLEPVTEAIGQSMKEK